MLTASTRSLFGSYGLLFLLALIWGATFVLIKWGMAVVEPVPFTFGRLLAAAVFMALVLAFTKSRLPPLGPQWKWIVLSAIFGNALPFTLLAWGQVVVEGGIGAILMGLMPLVTIVLAHFFTQNEGLTPLKFFGVFLGFSGLIVLVGPSTVADLFSDEQSNSGRTIRLGAILLASTCYAVNALMSKQLVSRDGIGMTAAVMFLSALLHLPFTLWLTDFSVLVLTPATLATIICMGIMQTAVGTLLLLVIIKRTNASFFSQINFLVPISGVLWTALILGERLPLAAWIALGLIICGIGVVQVAQNRQ